MSNIHRAAATALLLLSLALSFACRAAEAATPDSRLAAALQSALEEFLAANPQAPGAVAWVSCPQLGPDWAGAAGHDARDLARPLTPAHTFRIASNTKTYVAATVLRLAEDGRLSLDSPVAALLPAELAAPLAADGYDLQSITVRQVLSHTAGLADHSGDDRYGDAIIADPQHRWTRLEQVRRCADLFDPLGPAPAPYRYSDTGYVLLGGIVEAVTQRPLAAAARDELGFGRLGLGATWWEQSEAAPAGAGPRAHQHIGDHDVTGWDASFDLYGGGGLVTDARDLGLFMRLLLKGRVLRGESTLAAMTGGGGPDYRLGLMVADLGGHLAYGHQGFWNTFAYHVPGLDATVSGAILSHDAANGRALAARLVEVLSRAATAPAAGMATAGD